MEELFGSVKNENNYFPFLGTILKKYVEHKGSIFILIGMW